jgi:hypothetical protein
MMAVSGIYQFIYISELALKLGVNHEKADKIAALMIMDGSLEGLIDQVASILANASLDKALLSFCLELNHITESIQSN